MAFTAPTFNLLCDVYTGPWLTKVLRISGLPCNLAMGRRVQQLWAVGFNAPEGAAAPNLLVPALSDVRDQICGGDSDLVEVPAGSGRWYVVALVDDVGKGFDNEYRLCALQKIGQAMSPGNFPGLFWPTPIP